MDLSEERHSDQGDVEDVGSVMLVGWEVCRSNGYRDKVIRVLDVIDKAFASSICCVAIQ